MSHVPVDTRSTLVQTRTGFFVLFSVFKKRMTFETGVSVMPSRLHSREWGDCLSYTDTSVVQPETGKKARFLRDFPQSRQRVAEQALGRSRRSRSSDELAISRPGAWWTS